jgi:hypothetical protein
MRFKENNPFTISEFLPNHTSIINLSLSHGNVLTELKHAVIKASTKNPDVELIMKNYRPFSNLPFSRKGFRNCCYCTI